MLRVKCPRKLPFQLGFFIVSSLLSLRNVVSSPFTFFLRLLQPKTKHCVANFPIFLTAYNNYVAKVVTPIWRRLNFAGFIFCPTRHMSCSIQSYFWDQWHFPRGQKILALVQGDRRLWGRDWELAFYFKPWFHIYIEREFTGFNWPVCPVIWIFGRCLVSFWAINQNGRRRYNCSHIQNIWH